MLRTMSRTLTQTTYGKPTKKDALVYKTLSTLPRWSQAVVESHGDYRQEAWLEDEIGGPLYQHQKSLPKLPVPHVDDTMERFSPTACPLSHSVEENLTLLQAIEKFPPQAAHLQERLQARAREYHDSSWLQHWWNTAGYLQVRDSVVINVSYYFHFQDDPSARSNVQRGAALLASTCEFSLKVASGALPAEQVGKAKTPLCSTPYKYMFHACRIPHTDMDSYKIYDPSRYNHAVVVRKGHLFRIDIRDPVTHVPYTVRQLEHALAEIVQQADKMPPATALGWLTAQDRNDWATARDLLIQNSKIREALEVVQSGAILLCLDDHSPKTKEECAHTFLHGDGLNRFFDKSIQLIVTENGKAGLCGEHSMMDGMPVVNYANHIVNNTYDKCNGSSSTKSAIRVEPIMVHLTDELQVVQTHISQARDVFDAHVGRHEITVQSFNHYGADFMKKSGYSPDAYVQMAMQVATYRLWGEQGGTYEATQVRPFLHGRTETTRTVSFESAILCQVMGHTPQRDEHVEETRKNKLKRLSDAVNVHVNYMKNASKGQGVDRHFLGLAMSARPDEALPDLYTDPVFIRSKRWRVSTSHLTHPKFENWGYGQVVPDGVGLSYSIHPQRCVFGITALREHGWTDRLSHLLEEALLEFRTMIEMDQSPSSKL